MNRQPNRVLIPVPLWLWLLLGLGVIALLANVLLTPVSRKPKLPRVAANLERIDVAKRMWASDHAGTNGAAVSEQELLPYFTRASGRTGLVSIASEVYIVNPIGTPPEARLEKDLGARFPKGTLVRWSTNAGCEILWPNPRDGSSGWQPLYPGTNRMPATPAVGSSL